MLTSTTARPILGMITLASFAAVGFALWTQYRWGMQPCPWCVLQRLICVAIGFAALPGSLSARRGIQVGSSLAVVALAVAGISAALWQHFVAAASPSCNLTLADRIVSGLRLDSALPQVFSPQASCADAAVSLLGVAYDLWTATLFFLLTLAAALALRARRHPTASDPR